MTVHIWLLNSSYPRQADVLWHWAKQSKFRYFEWDFPIFVSSFIVSCCLKYVKKTKLFPFIRSSYYLKFDAQIASNGVSGSLCFKLFPGEHGPGPTQKSRAFAARCDAFINRLHDSTFQASFATWRRDKLSRN